MKPIDLTQLKVYPLAERRSLTRTEDILVPLASPPEPLSESLSTRIVETARRIRLAREKGAQVILMYGAHLLRNGAALLLTDLMERGWITHLATNGAGTIHDWEYAWHGESSESVRDNVATGTFGTWDETGRNIHLALHAGALLGLGYGRALGKFIHEDGADFPSPNELAQMISQFPADPLSAGCCDLLSAMNRFGLQPGRHTVTHRWKQGSLLAQAWRLNIPVTIHPGIGYDIITCHPMFNGAVIGRAAGEDFRLFAGAVDGLDGGVVLSVGSAIMAPQVFEKSLSCVHNLRLNSGRSLVKNHSIHIVDLQDGGNWDWTQGEPPKESAAYYLRFCKTFSRMGGEMHYLQSDNVVFLHNLLHCLKG